MDIKRDDIKRDDVKIISIIPVWEEQNMIGLSLASTKDFVYQYIILLQKSNDKSRDVIEYCQKIWNLNIIIIETEVRLREKRRMAINAAKSYADYYLIQDADEIYYEDCRERIYDLINDGFTFCHTSILFLEKTLLHTPKDESQIWLVPHPFLFKNVDDIYFPDFGDMPLYNPNMDYHKIFTTGDKKNPFKFDCKIKNFKRVFLRDIFTPWHDNMDFKGNIEEYADKYHHTVIWYRQNVDASLGLDEIIDRYEKHITSSDEEYFKWHKLYDENEYHKYPEIIRKFIDWGKIKGVENLDDLKYLDKL
jgi:hypothetical protein